MAGPTGGLGHQLMDCTQRCGGLGLILFLAGYDRKAQQYLGRYRAAAGLGIIKYVPGPYYQRFMVDPGVVKAT